MSEVALAADTVANVAPKKTIFFALSVLKLVPVIVTVVPTTPEAGEKELMVVGKAYVNRSVLLVVLVPLGVVTVISTVPTDPAGAVAVICVSEFTVKLVAEELPNFTFEALVKLTPVMTTEIPPVILLLEGEIDAIIGKGLTVTVTICAIPSPQPPVAVGVTVYVTVWTEVELLTIVLLKVLVVCRDKLSPVVLGLSAATHVYVEAKLLVSGIFTVAPLFITSVEVLLITGFLGMAFLNTETEASL